MVYKLVFENLKHRPVRTLLSTLAIGLGVTMILTLVGLSNGMLDDQKRRARATGADIIILPPGSSAINARSAPIPEKMLDFVRAQPHVAVATGTAVHGLGGVFSSISGMDLETFGKMSNGTEFLEGGMFQSPNDIIVDDFYAAQYKVKVGSILKNILNREWRVCGVVRSGKLARLIIPLRLLQELSSNTGRLTMIYAKLDNPANTDSVIEELKKPLSDYKILSMEEFTSQFSVNSLPELKAFIGVIIGVSVVFGFLVVFLAMYTAVLERTREIGVLKALGASQGYILGIMMRETALLSVFGAITGIVMSFLTRWLFQYFIPATMQQAIVPEWWPISGIVTLLGALLGVLYPALKAARADALESLSYD